jgi:hypothetical protein
VRKRDIKIGMEVRHARATVSMGHVTDIGNAVIYGTYLNGVNWIAHQDELQPFAPRANPQASPGSEATDG